MPLPKSNAPWPLHSVASEKLAEWSAWYSGDPDTLATFYGPRSGVVARPAQYRGGVAGRLARWWWGQPTPAGEQRSKLHVPLASDICRTSADLLFSEPIQLSTEDDSLAAAFADLQEDGLDSRLHEGAEVQSAMGGVYLRTVWDEQQAPMPWTETAHPDGAIPEWRRGRLHAVTLWVELASDRQGEVFRLFERHESGGIMYALYKGTATNVGKPVPVQTHPEAAHLAELVPGGAFLEGVTILQPTNITNLTVAYVPNMLPNPLRRHSPEGRSDLQGVEPWLDALDEAYSSWWRDIRHAKARLHVPSSMIGSGGPGTPGYVDVDREVYVPLEGVLVKPGDTLPDMMQAQQFAIRVAEHRETCEFWTTKIIESAGYSTQSLSSGAGGAVTAAEVHSHERRSYMTRGKKARYWTAALRQHLRTQVEVANTHLRAGIREGDFTIEFPDGVQESPQQMGATLQTLRNAEAASVKTRVQMLHPDWDGEAVDTEVSAILRETGAGEPLPIPDDAGL